MLQPLETVRVLEWLDFQPGAFGGFSDVAQAIEFDRTIAPVFAGIGWCGCHAVLFINLCADLTLAGALSMLRTLLCERKLGFSQKNGSIAVYSYFRRNMCPDC